MRVVDLDRDMSDVIPTGTTRDSEYLFDRMTAATLGHTLPGPGRRILDVASGFGQDAILLQEQGAKVVGAEPSERMMAWARMKSEEATGPLPFWVRGWSDGLPFADDSFDAAFCKGALDHFDRPAEAIREMARVTRPGRPGGARHRELRVARPAAERGPRTTCANAGSADPCAGGAATYDVPAATTSPATTSPSCASRRGPTWISRWSRASRSAWGLPLLDPPGGPPSRPGSLDATLRGLDGLAGRFPAGWRTWSSWRVARAPSPLRARPLGRPGRWLSAMRGQA